MFMITEAPIDTASVLSEISDPRNGAVATFMGIVRKHSGERAVKGLFYEAYEPMALKSFEAIALEARVLWQITDLSIAHRIGSLSVGEMAVFIAASAPHRKDALAACEYAIDRVKEISPIWKKDIEEAHQLVHAS